MNRYQMNSLSIEAEEDARQPPSNFVKYLTIFGSMAAVSFVAVTSIGSTAYTNSASATTNMKASVMERGEVPKYGPMEDKEKARLFELFQEQYGRKYSDEAERLERYTIFKKFLDTVDHRNAMENQKKGAVHGITKFADMTDAEFKKFLGYRPSTKRSKTIAKVPKYKGSATSVDWTGKYTTAVKDQGYCGSCWAFSATEQIESDSIRAGLLTTSDELSPQQIVSCDSIDLGCDGGNTETAYMYVMEAGGIDSATDYPYTSYWDVTGTCSVTSDFEVGITNFYNIEQDEDTMIDYVLSTGPLSVCLDASTWSSYTSGIVTAAACGTDVDHCVQAVGLNEDEGYWIVRNSWGTTWGLDGFIYLELGTDACLITTDPSYVVPTAV